jgi:toxin ParE1/3/4
MQVRWTTSAVRDLTQICDYIDQHDGAASARRVALAIYQGVNSLARFPFLGRSGRKPTTRELPCPGLPYLVIYRIREEIVEISRILHGAQKWP